MKRTKEIERMISDIEGVKVHLDELASRKQEAFDNKSERWQEGDKGQEESELISSIEEARDEAESLMDKMIELYPED